MAIKINEVDVLQKYIDGVVARADHHAQEVKEILFPLIGVIIWKKSGTIEVLEKNGKIGNVLWVNIGDKRYAFSYNHEDSKIEMRKNIKGEVLHSFDNNTGIDEIVKKLEAL